MSLPALPGGPSCGLRERKKARTRRDIRRAAYRLFAANGYDATDVDRIAAEAEVSRSTFFRYFPTKEDVVLTDEYNTLMAEGLAARPAGEPVMEAVRQVAVTALGALLAADREELLFRMHLIATVPAVRARAMDEQFATQDAICALIARRGGRDPRDLDVRCAAAAVVAVSSTIVQHWVEEGGTADLAALYDRHLGQLAGGLRI